MKILELHIYGFGQLSNVNIKDLSDFQVFYGENEAGKSTIMAFIHSIFFGFPTKQQSSELRYEPKNDTKYGGKIRIYHHEFGHAVIERLKGKATGDVNVTIDDGTTGGEELLKQLLANIDKGLFQAVFSFNLHGLQNIHQMKGEDLGKFLFSTGALGTERLANTEMELQKELDTRFKPSGKKPDINERLKKIHELNTEVKKAAAKNLQYEELIKENETVQQEMKMINGSLQEIQTDVNKLNEWKKIQTLVIEENWIKKEISRIGEFPFPVKGIERLEKINQLIYPYNAQISSLVERLDLLKKEISTIQPDTEFLKEESAILSFLDKVPLHEQFKLEYQQCVLKLAELEEKISIIKEKLHLPLNEEEVFNINTNIYMKNQVEQVSQNNRKLAELKRELEESFYVEKNSLEELEEKVQIAKGQLISTHEKTRIENLLNEEGHRTKVREELKGVQEKIELFQFTKERDKKTIEMLSKQKHIQFIAIELLLICFSSYGLYTKQWLFGAIGVLGCLLAFIFFKKNSTQKKVAETNMTLNQLNEKEQELLKKLKTYKDINTQVLQEQLNMDNRRRDQLHLLTMKLEQQQVQYEKVMLKFEDWEQEEAKNKKILKKICAELHIPEYIANSFLLEAFQLIEQYKLTGREKKHLLARMETIRLEQVEFMDKLTSYSKKYLGEEGHDTSKLAYLLRNKLKDEHEKLVKNQEKQAKLEDLLADIQQIKQEQAHLMMERTKLYKEANVEDEELFYDLGKQAEKKGKLKERLEDLQTQLQYSLLKEEEWETFLHIQNVEEQISQFNEKTEALVAEMQNLQEKHATTKYQIQLLEEGGSYSELLHYYKQKRYELDEAAKEWSVYCIAQDILSRTIEKYKNVHLPRMLAKAEEYLFFLTDGNYQRIHLQKSGTGFLIERKDHTIFEANELSQATTEQVYVSIRLALATTIYDQYNFPIIIDDSFVNFDAGRTQKVMELLNTLKKNQILFFTCHTHLLQYFVSANVLYLQNGAVKVNS